MGLVHVHLMGAEFVPEHLPRLKDVLDALVTAQADDGGVGGTAGEGGQQLGVAKGAVGVSTVDGEGYFCGDVAGLALGVRTIAKSLDSGISELKGYLA